MSTSPTHVILAVFGALVLGFAVYLLVEVHATPAHAGSGGGSAVATERPPRPVTPDKPDDAPAAEPPAVPTGVHTIGSRVRPGQQPLPPATPVEPGNLKSASAGSGDDRHVDPHADALMLEANKSYDAGNYDEAKATAEKVLADQPHNVRMLRVLVSVACLDGDSANAQKSYDLLPKPDRDQMKIRCGRSGVTFTDSVPPP